MAHFRKDVDKSLREDVIDCRPNSFAFVPYFCTSRYLICIFCEALTQTEVIFRFLNAAQHRESNRQRRQAACSSGDHRAKKQDQAAETMGSVLGKALWARVDAKSTGRKEFSFRPVLFCPLPPCRRVGQAESLGEVVSRNGPVDKVHPKTPTLWYN